MRRPVTSHELPFPGSRPSATMLASVMLTRGGPAEAWRLAAGTVVDDQDRRQAIAVLRIEAARDQLEVGDRLRIERAGQPEQAIRVVDLDAVHHGEVLVRRRRRARSAGCRTR